MLKGRGGHKAVAVDGDGRKPLPPGLSRAGQSSLGTLARGTESTDGTRIAREVLVVFALELGDEVAHHAVVEVFSTQVHVPRHRLHLQYALF
jgi:hypothetical protein